MEGQSGNLAAYMYAEKYSFLTYNHGGTCECAEGLKSHCQYELARRQMRGYSGMVTFYIKGAEDEARRFLSNLKVIASLHPSV